MRAQRFVVLGTGAILALAMAGPVAGYEPAAPTGSIDIHLHVIGYNVGSWGDFGGALSCPGGAEPIDVAIPGGSAEASSGPVEVPADVPCTLQDLGSGDPGDYAWWGDPQVTSGEPFSVSAGGTTVVDVEIERGWTGDDPSADVSSWYGFEVFTIDRVYLNRYGGITAEGLILCSSLAEAPFGHYVGIDWTATQYLGRRTAIHGGYQADIANGCFDPEHPATPQRWVSMHPTQTGAVTAWVYGTDGRFGAGIVHIDAAIGGEEVFVTQYWDPDSPETYDPGCTAAPTDNGFYDLNGDGFCTFSIGVGQRAWADVRTTPLKGR